MKTLSEIKLSDVQTVYSGAEGELWEMIMGQQIHIGGYKSSMDLAEKAGIGRGMTGVDLCCCNGAGMRFLTRFRGVDKMFGVDATKHVLELAKERSEKEGFSERNEYVLADVCETNLPESIVDFAWGEDAWCYVVDKPQLIKEAARVVKPGGLIAFNDWLEGDSLTDAEAQRFLRFMKFPNILNQSDYSNLLEQNGCEVVCAENTGRFAPYVDLYLQMVDMQLYSDALRIVGYNAQVFEAMVGEMLFMQELAHSGKIIQGLFVARKN